MDFISRLRNVSLELEKSYIKDLINVIDVIYQECDVVERGTKKFVSKEELIVRCKLGMKNDICKAMCQSGSKCIRKCVDGGEYCKMHIGLSIKYSMNVVSVNDKDMNGVDMNGVDMNGVDMSGVDMSGVGMETKFIEDTFYYVDEKYVYDRGTMERVGYRSGGEYILTSDPFILGCV